MELWFASRTGQVEQIVSRLNLKNVYRIENGNEVANQEYVLLTYTDGFGEIPEIVEKFLKRNHSLMKGVAGSGNKNFGKNFCKSAHIIKEKYQVPLLMTFDLRGSDDDIIQFRDTLFKLGVS